MAGDTSTGSMRGMTGCFESERVAGLVRNTLVLLNGICSHAHAL